MQLLQGCCIQVGNNNSQNAPAQVLSRVNDSSAVVPVKVVVTSNHSVTVCATPLSFTAPVWPCYGPGPKIRDPFETTTMGEGECAAIQACSICLAFILFSLKSSHTSKRQGMTFVLIFRLTAVLRYRRHIRLPTPDCVRVSDPCLLPSEHFAPGRPERPRRRRAAQAGMSTSKPTWHVSACHPPTEPNYSPVCHCSSQVAQCCVQAVTSILWNPGKQNHVLARLPDNLWLWPLFTFGPD